MKKFQHVVIGGTFDHFHLGHKKLIDTAFAISQNVLITIATEKLYRNKFLSQTIESYAVRKKTLEAYLKEKNYFKQTRFSFLNDIYGKTRTDLTIEAIIVSKATYPNALKINQRKKRLGLKPLQVIIIPYVLDTEGKIISSERIRAGEIDRDGRSYFKVFADKKCLLLPEHFRENLRKPLGQIIKGKEDDLVETAKKAVQAINYLKPTLVVAVGDIVAMSLWEAGLIPAIQIIDFKSRRKVIDTKRSRRILDRTGLHSFYINQPGTINPQIAQIYKQTLKQYFVVYKTQTIIIDGEEDLTALVAMLLSPLNSVVLYGQFDLGIILTQVTETKKKSVEKLLQQFHLP